jgi:tRNA(fMet)-specific endonuclease VapC
VRYMLDTDISSYIMKRSPPGVLERLKKVSVADLFISAITHSELMFGVEVSPRHQKDQSALDEFLRYVEVLSYPREAGLHYAQIRRHLRQRGTMIGANDLLIAAHARCLQLVLVTHNVGEFRRVPGLKIEDWS